MNYAVEVDLDEDADDMVFSLCSEIFESLSSESVAVLASDASESPTSPVSVSNELLYSSPRVPSSTFK